MENRVILEKVTEYFDEAVDTTKGARDLANTYRDYYDGKHWTETEKAALEKRGQPAITDNVLKDKIDYLMGLERRSRTDPKAYPRNPDDQASAEAATDALRYVAENNDFDDVRSDVAENMFVEGYGVGEIQLRNVNDRAEIRLVHIPWDRFFIDPHSMRRDARDARYMGQAIWMDLEEAQRKYPKFKGELVDLAEEGKHKMDESYADKPIAKWIDIKRKRVRVIEMYYLEGGKCHRCVFSRDAMFEPPTESKFPDDDGDPWYPYEILTAYVDRDGNRYGVVQRYRDLQDEINKRRSKALHLLTTRQVVAEKGAVPDVEHARREMSKPDGYIEKTPGMAFEIQQNGDMANGQFQLLVNALQSLSTTGPNATMMGSEGSTPSGRAQQVKQQAGVVELGPLFDQIRNWQKRVYRRLWACIQTYWTDERWVRIRDEDQNMKFVQLNKPITQGEQIVQQMKERGQPIDPAMIDQIAMNPAMRQQVDTENNLAELDVDIIVDDAPDIINLQQEQFEQLVQLATSGVPIPPDVIIEASSLRNKERLLELLRGDTDDPRAQAQAQEQQRQAQKAEQMADVMFQAEVEGKKAEAAKDIAQAEKYEIDADTSRKKMQIEAVKASYGQ